MSTTSHPPKIVKVAPSAPQATAALDAERRLLAHYGLQAQSRYVDLKRTPIRVRVLEIGSGAPVVCIPGGSGEAYQFLPMLAHLKSYRLMVVNRVGGGLSDLIDHRQVDLQQLAVDMVESVMDAFGLDSAHIIANSMGGRWAFWFAQAHPERVQRMVQLGCTALVLNTSAPFIMRLMSVPRLNTKLVNVVVPKDADAALQGLKFMGSTPEAISTMAKPLGETNVAMSLLPTFRETWTTLMEAVLTPLGAQARYQLSAADLGKAPMPTLFIWGDHDPFGGLDVARKVVAAMPNAQLKEVSAGHLPHADQPEACARFADEFLQA